MAGERYVDVFAGPLVKGPANADRIAADTAGVLWVSVKGAPFVKLLPAQLGLTFEQETLLYARLLMPGLGFNRAVGTDFDPIWEAAIGGTTAPTIDNTFAGGVIQFPATGGASLAALNPVTPGATTYNPLLGTFDTLSTAWMIRGRWKINAQAVTAAKTIVLCGIDGSGVGGTGATHKIHLKFDGTFSGTQCVVSMQNNTGGGTSATYVLTGPDGVLGGANSQIPVNQWFTATLYFDGINVRWMFNDQFNALNFADATIGQMDFAPGDAASSAQSVIISSDDNTIGVNLKCDALAFAFCATAGNN